jgi:hypothetical protein
MIKSKIDARERALELAIAHYNGIEGNRILDAVETAKQFESYLIGDAELPEVTDDNAHIKELLEIANKSFDNSRKCNNDEIDCLFKGVSADVTSKIPCKSDIE